MKRRKRLLWGLLALLLLSILLGLFWPRERRLLERAGRVTDTHGWSVDRGPDACISYGWLSDQDVFFCQGGFQSKSPLCRRNIRTGEETPLTGLSRLFQITRGDPADLIVSPDGRWVLWSDSSEATLCAAIDGSSFRRYPWTRNSYSSFRWIGDRKAQWVEFAITNTTNPHQWYQALLREAATPHASVLYKEYDRTSDLPLEETIIRSEDGVCMLSASWEAADSAHPRDHVEITETSLDASLHQKRHFSLPIPQDREVTRIVLSPDGKQAAWLSRVTAAYPMLLWAHRLFPRIDAPLQRHTELWVSGIDGSRMREIGHLTVTTDRAGRESDLDGATLRWLPDSRRLSFIFQDSLYIVPID